MTDSGAPNSCKTSDIPPVNDTTSLAVTHHTRHPRSRADSATASATVDLPYAAHPSQNPRSAGALGFTDQGRAQFGQQLDSGL